MDYKDKFKDWKPGDTIFIRSPFEPETKWQKVWRILTFGRRKLRGIDA